jgi:hypothetical protein
MNIVTGLSKAVGLSTAVGLKMAVSLKKTGGWRKEVGLKKQLTCRSSTRSLTPVANEKNLLSEKFVIIFLEHFCV